MEVLDVDRDQLDLRKLAREVVEPALERARQRLRAARPFRKDDQRKAMFERVAQRLERIGVRILAAAIDHDDVQFVARDRAADARPVPVVLRRDRPRVRTQFLRQRGPQHHRVHVAGVIAEIDALRRCRRRADPARIGADEQARQPHDRRQELQWTSLMAAFLVRELCQGTRRAPCRRPSTTTAS